MSNKLDQIMVTFFEECEDLLGALQEDLGDIESQPDDKEKINGVFRAVHSIKGGAGAFGLDDLVKFAHGFETVLNDLRNGDISISPAIISLLWRSNDLLSDLVSASQNQTDTDPAIIDGLLEELEKARPDHLANEVEKDLEFTPVGLPFSMDLDLPSDDAETEYLVYFKPDFSFYSNGNEASFFLRSLAELGEMTAVCDLSGLPDFTDFEAGSAYLGWHITLNTTRTGHEIREIFEFAEGTCILNIARKEDGQPEGGIESEAEPQPTTISIADVQLPDKTPAKTAEKPAVKKTATVRVEVERVDRLINLVGELVVAQAILTQCIEELDLSSEPDLDNSIDELKMLSREIQDSVMTVRAQPVKPLFQRMSRIVREASSATGKNVQLLVVGEATEIDKTVIEKLADPLTHMLRNAIDHGLETPEDRLKSGKPETGTVTLSAAHRSGRVVIDVSDDGGGINRERVKNIALEKGLISATETLAPEDIDAILFLPGFSTVDKVSELSGRGVGMDVVKTAIKSLGGQISVSSQPGLGSKFSISLPLTLAVLDGMVVELGTQRYILPITSIIELIRLGTEKIHKVDGALNAVSIRGDNVRVVDVGYALGIREELDSFDNSVLVLVEVEDGSRCAMAFDGIQDQRQVVIKSLASNYADVLGVAAATILGDGRIALILDPNDAAFNGKTTELPYDMSLSRTG